MRRSYFVCEDFGGLVGGITEVYSRRMLKKAVQQGRSE
jgi:hypothetical protein